MAQMETQNNVSEIKEPSPKIQKLMNQNGISDHSIIPFLRVKKLSEKAVLPSRGSPLSAGYDLSRRLKCLPRGKALVPTDLSIAVPEGTYARIVKYLPLSYSHHYLLIHAQNKNNEGVDFVNIAPRSGLTWKHSIDVGAGVIDADYRGPVGAIVFNHSDTEGDRIAQLIIEKIVTPQLTEVDDLDSTIRGAGGFGSTGV